MKLSPFQLLATTLYVVVSVSGEYLHLTVIGDDLINLNTKNMTAAGTLRSLVKRAPLYTYSRPAAVQDTLNSIRRLKPNFANMHYVVRT